MLAKVFVFDPAALESLWRVVSFVGLGLLLLLAALAYQRLRAASQAPGERGMMVGDGNGSEVQR